MVSSYTAQTELLGVAGRRGKGRRAEATADADHEHVYLQEMQHLDQVSSCVLLCT